MDRNYGSDLTYSDGVVALRKESVDRNFFAVHSTRKGGVALRKESVDRNVITRQPSIQKQLVALRKESVDRNDTDVGIPNANTESLSARRAWIEIR